MAVKKLTGDPDWENLRFFEHLSRLRTLSATARALRVTHATVSRRLDRIEALFGEPLFDRTSAGYLPTRLGQDLMAAASDMRRASLAVAALRRRSGDARSVVRVSAPRSIADSFVTPNLDAVRERLAAVELLLTTDSRIVSIAKWETDIAIRLGRPKDGGMVARKVGEIRYRLMAVRGAPLGSFIGYPDEDTGTEAIWLERFAGKGNFAVRSNSQVAQRGAAVAGLGVALLPHYLAGPPLDLVSSLPDHPPDREVFILTRREALRQAPIRAAADALAELFRLRWPVG